MTKGKIRVFVFCFCYRASFLSSNLISARVFETRVSGYHLSIRLVLKNFFFIAVLNAALEELVRRSLSASPFMKPFLTPGG